jgi:hypothetical protein
MTESTTANPREWFPISTGPQNASNVHLKLAVGTELIGHWACNLSGEELMGTFDPNAECAQAHLHPRRKHEPAF